ncbi:TetR/AcrR family transcriptional regulator [Flammeovirga yaeyamensis]|uniref:TetR/AcrR family transcriptional regulator n=1 Tax=Flammeovirga yaeyamensis TaxID=367791 RepID=A0AAX1N5F3_9BACT|nr:MULTISPECIES: TetR/AcrR family transcriptional regulator [Flammeovirga]ANQ50127.1 TetR/AcrR family transcriptional regulator [Flammeovirga sp. MY04]MBB3700349.1 AcrR family transcriptional regulator [Flammeovirga yaeyamensis]NMF37025.1 TetR/AcrR family transcriptional regulator [Flammeovirga yaeyamensis]QWG02432.1 TetR/AcrR family transcriptional regulator [Flammeovirga yaeyamensis]
MTTDQLKIRIIDEARKQFKAYGIKRVTMSGISNELGISKKTLYNVFKDKEEMISSSIEHHITEDIEYVDKVTDDQSLDGVFKLASIFFFFFTRIKDINPLTFMDLKKFYPEMYRKFECHKKGCFFDSMEKIMSQGIKEKFFLEDINVPLLVSMRMWQLETALDTSVYDHSKYSVETIQLEMFKHFIRGIATTEGILLLDKYLKNFINESQSSNI